MNLVTKWIVLLVAAFTSTACLGQKGDSIFTPEISGLEDKIAGILDSAHIPGMNIAVINRHKLIWNKVFGVVNKESGIKVNEQTVFPAASLGKPVFAYAVLKLADRGKIHLDSTIVSYVPIQYLEEKFLHGKLKDEDLKLVTIRMILSHSSGLPNWRASGDTLKTLFKPGTRYSYSGEGYFLLQLAVEYIMKQPIERVMESIVFKPLHMVNSTYLANTSTHFTSSYGNDGKIFTVDPREAANVAHTFKSNATDYAHFIIAIMNGTGLRKATWKEMFSPQITTDICKGSDISWALGFAVQQTPHGNTFFQWGKSPNSSAYFIGFKNSGSAVVYFTNIANQGLRIGEVLVQNTLDYMDPLFSCFGVKQYNK